MALPHFNSNLDCLLGKRSKYHEGAFMGGADGLAVLDMLNPKIQVLAIVDADSKKQGTVLSNIPIISENQICESTYDFLIISNIHSQEIIPLLHSKDYVPADKIMDPFCSGLVDVRLGTLKRLAGLIRERNLPGVVSELGVYKGGADMVLTMSPAHSHPSFNMTFMDGHSEIKIAIPLPERVFRRQDVRPIYKITPVCYVTCPAFVQSLFGALSRPTTGVVVPLEDAIDIDTPLDFEFADFLYQKRLQKA